MKSKKPAAKKAPKPTRIKKYIAEKRKIMRLIGKSFEQMGKVLLAELHTAVKEHMKHTSPMDAVQWTLECVLDGKTTRLFVREEAPIAAKAVLVHFRKTFGVELRELCYPPKFFRGDYFPSGIAFDFTFPKFQTLVERRLGETPVLICRASLLSHNVELRSTVEAAGLEDLDLADLREVKKLWDEFVGSSQIPIAYLYGST